MWKTADRGAISLSMFTRQQPRIVYTPRWCDHHQHNTFVCCSDLCRWLPRGASNHRCHETSSDGSMRSFHKRPQLHFQAFGAGQLPPQGKEVASSHCSFQEGTVHQGKNPWDGEHLNPKASEQCSCSGLHQQGLPGGLESTRSYVKRHCQSPCRQTRGPDVMCRRAQ